MHNVHWHGQGGSALLEALQQASANGGLSININVYGYGRDPDIPRYTLGHVTGSIGPYLPDEPKHFVLGRQMIAACPSAPFAPAAGVYSYSTLLNALHNCFNGDPGNIDTAIGLMYSLKIEAVALMQTMDPHGSGLSVGPSFEYINIQGGMG